MSIQESADWPHLSPSTLTDQVYTVLRDRIVEGRVAPGEFVREQEVSSALGVSRTPVREALGRLASEGFLERIAHRGFRVPEESVADLLELYPILATLEVLAGQDSLPRLDAATLAELRALNREYADAAENGDFTAGIELNDRFHHVLSRESRNSRLETMLDGLRETVRRLETWTFATHPRDWTQSVREHDEILDAVEAGNVEQALETLRANRLMTYRQFRREIGTATQDPQPVEN